MPRYRFAQADDESAGSHRVTVSETCHAAQLNLPTDVSGDDQLTRANSTGVLGTGAVEGQPPPAQTGRRARSRRGERPPGEPPMTVAEERDEREDEVGRVLISREEAAKRLGVSLTKLDEWSYEPGFPVLRERGHFVRIYAPLLDQWLAERAAMANRAQSYQAPPSRRPRRARPEP
jgi:hypothetical protein